MDDELLNIEKRQKLVRAGKMHSMHWLIVLLSVILTFSAWYYSQFQQSQKLEIQFQREADNVVDSVKQRMNIYENVLWGGVAYIDAANSDTTYQQWAAYTNSLQIDINYPGINGFGVIYNIPPDGLDSYLQKQHEQRPDYNVHPNHDNAEYWPITYVEPVSNNAQAIGLDVAFEKNRYSSIKRARDSGKALLTAPIILVQDDKRSPGFLFYTPFYKGGVKPDTLEQRRNLIEGVTYAPFIMEKLMKGTLSEKNRHVNIKIWDGEDLLFDNHGNDTEIDSDPLFSKNIETAFYGRTWTFSIQSNISFRQDTTLHQSSIILAGGLIIDVFLLMLFLFLTQANRQALKYAEQVTDELKDKTIHLEKSNNDLEKSNSDLAISNSHLEKSNSDLERSNTNLEKSNSDLEQFSYVASHDLKSPLNAIEQLASWIEEDCEDILPEDSKKHLVLLRQRSKRMLKLLDDLLDYSRLNLNTVENHRVNLSEKTQDILSLLETNDNFICTAPDIEINIPLLPFEIVLRNLISNSIKHHDKNEGHIIITYAMRNNFHEITIEDDGPGIPEAFHEKAMEMFQTLQSRDKVEGSGMGLAMIKRIVEHYHGSVNILSDGERGTKINILWPQNS